MDDELVEMEVDSYEFTLAEIIEMVNLFKGMKEKTLCQDFCQELANKFSCSPLRKGKSFITWKQVQDWFQDKQKAKKAKAISALVVENESVAPQPRPATKPKTKVRSSSLVLAKKFTTTPLRARVPHFALESSLKPRVSAEEMAAELSELTFEALSAKDLAWYDVAAFLNFRVLLSGELEVRVRFAGFGNVEDEWVNVKRGIRERSIPLEPSECDRVNVGDLVLCYRENEYHALYGDAHVVEIQKRLHDIVGCRCIFVVQYHYDNAKEKVTLDKLCCRPKRENSEVDKLHGI